jgi:uncharacterized protein (DUF433 family)
MVADTRVRVFIILEAKFEEFKNKGWNDKRILKVYPDLAPFMDDESIDEDD